MINNHWSHLVLEETCMEENKISNFKLGLIILSCEDIIGLLRLKETSDIIIFFLSSFVYSAYHHRTSSYFFGDTSHVTFRR